MKKRFLAFGPIYLLTAAFIGSAEAKTINATYDAGAGKIQLAASPSSRLYIDATPDGSIDELESLLALYYGIEVEKYAIDPGDPSTENEVSPTDEEEPLLGDEFWLGQLTYADSYLSQTATSSASVGGEEVAVQTTAPGSTGDKAEEADYKTIPISSYDPPIVIHISGPTQSSEPTAANDPAQPKKDPAQPKKWKVTPDSAPVSGTTETVNLPPATPDFTETTDIPPIVLVNSAGKNKKPGTGPKVKVPDGAKKVDPPDVTTVASPAPVPEPATILLLSAGIAGLAFRSRRNNKMDMTGK